MPFRFPYAQPVNDWRIGYIESQLTDGERNCLEALKGAGATCISIEKLPDRFPLEAMLVALDVEAATSFDDLLRSGPLRGLGAWPNIFREGQFVPAVHYLRASRLRTELIREAEEFYSQFDVVLGSDDLLLTNLTGHPSLIVTADSMRVRGEQRPWPIKLTSRYWGEDRLLTIAAWLQQKLPPQPQSPEGFGWE
jgi:Asp-tRNA(Asn)/Glu-tRNA(Gln) amidotransferase A subunit family amidase